MQLSQVVKVLQDIQFLIVQASQVGTAAVDFKNPAAQVSHKFLLFGQIIQFAIVHFPNPTSKKYPSAAFLQFATSLLPVPQSTQLAAHLFSMLALR